MGLFDFLKPRKQKSVLETVSENPLFQEQKALFDAMNKVCSATGCDGDELPNGYGEFGLTPTNPIPTNTIMGSKTYLSELLTADGKKVHSKRRCSMRSEVTETPIDVYDLSSPDGTPRGAIYISPWEQKNSSRAPRGFRLLFSDTESPAPSNAAQAQRQAKYPVSVAIAEFDSFLTIVGSQTTQRPEYAQLKASWPGLLQFLQPIVTGERLFGDDAIEYAALRFQREQTSITDERATERAIYFGIMSFTIIIFNKFRERYAGISLDELGENWLSQALTPMESLEKYGTLIQEARPRIEALAKHFLIRHVEPAVTDKSKMDDALGWFATQFLSGVLLGQMTDYLTLRNHYEERDE